MKANKKKTWQYETSGVEGNVILFGVNIFDYTWNETGEKAHVEHPQFDQDYVFPVYKTVINGEEYTFACGEFSNLVYGFYVYRF